jgi:hypothetical protein
VVFGVYGRVPLGMATTYVDIQDAELLKDAATDSAPQFDEAAWEKQGKEIANRESQSKWDLGKWLEDGKEGVHDVTDIPGAREAGELTFYKRAAKITGYAPSTLSDILCTYRKAASVRTEGASWNHHRVVLHAVRKLREPDKQKADTWVRNWLQDAAKEHISVETLKEILKRDLHKRRDLAGKSAPSKRFLVTVPEGIFVALKEMAAGDDLTVAEFVRDHLSEYVASDDGAARHKIAKLDSAERRLAKQVKNGQRLQKSYPGKNFGN